MPKLIFINGPNLSRLGIRKTDIYGSMRLQDIEKQISEQATEEGWEFRCFSSNHEGEIIDFIDQHRNADGVIINPGALMINGWSLREALEDHMGVCIEVHISNVWAREAFRHDSVLSPVCNGVIAGLGIDGYFVAFSALLRQHRK